MTAKASMEMAVPAGLMTAIGAVVAPVGTVAASSVSEWIIKVLAGMLPNCTAVTPVNPLPVTVTSIPTKPEVGVKPLILGTTMTVNEPIELTVPAGLVSLIGPVVAPIGTATLSRVSDWTV
jgi:hypothetical protein